MPPGGGTVGFPRRSAPMRSSAVNAQGRAGETGFPPRDRAESEGGEVRRFRLPLLLLGGAIALVLGDRRFGSRP